MKDDEYLYQFRQAPRREFSEALYQRLTRPQKPRFNSVLSYTIGISSLMIILGVGLLVLPPTRAFAQYLVHQLGNLFITNQPTYAEQYEALLRQPRSENIQPTNPSPIEWKSLGLLSLSEAENLAGFPVLELVTLSGDMTLKHRTVTQPDEQNPCISVISAYQSGKQKFVLRQSVCDPQTKALILPVGESPTKAVSVQGADGIWIENLRLSTSIDQNNQVSPEYANVLIWEKDGYQFWLQSNPGLSLEIILDLASTLQP